MLLPGADVYYKQMDKMKRIKTPRSGISMTGTSCYRLRPESMVTVTF